MLKRAKGGAKLPLHDANVAPSVRRARHMPEGVTYSRLGDSGACERRSEGAPQHPQIQSGLADSLLPALAHRVQHVHPAREQGAFSARSDHGYHALREDLREVDDAREGYDLGMDGQLTRGDANIPRDINSLQFTGARAAKCDELKDGVVSGLTPQPLPGGRAVGPHLAERVVNLFEGEKFHRLPPATERVSHRGDGLQHGVLVVFVTRKAERQPHNAKVVHLDGNGGQVLSEASTDHALNGIDREVGESRTSIEVAQHTLCGCPIGPLHGALTEAKVFGTNRDAFERIAQNDAGGLLGANREGTGEAFGVLHSQSLARFPHFAQVGSVPARRFSRGSRATFAARVSAWVTADPCECGGNEVNAPLNAFWRGPMAHLATFIQSGNLFPVRCNLGASGVAT